MKREQVVWIRLSAKIYRSGKIMHVILVAPFRGMIDAFLESALEMGNRFSTTPKPHLRAKIVAPPLT